jgi:hypothetical protein
MKRTCNKEDKSNLRKIFSGSQNQIEFISPTAANVPKHLSSEGIKKIFRNGITFFSFYSFRITSKEQYLFFMQNKYNVNFTLHFPDKPPTLFILFILSHGAADGKIMTDQKAQGTTNNESFTTGAVFRALKDNKWLDKALKLVILGVSFEYLLFRAPVCCLFEN